MALEKEDFGAEDAKTTEQKLLCWTLMQLGGSVVLSEEEMSDIIGKSKYVLTAWKDSLGRYYLKVEEKS